MTNTKYSIDDQHGTNICGGLSEHNAHAVAKRHANSMRETVYLYVDGSNDEPEAVEPDEREAQAEDEPSDADRDAANTFARLTVEI